MATVNGRFTKSTMDGFGRVTKVESGYSGAAVLVTDSEYAPCACSPLGKLKRVSLPHAPGGSPVWTTYTYDGSGRTLAVTASDGSTTHYTYQGNQTTTTDPTSKWKTFTSSAAGDLLTVTEPNPAGGTFTTSYTYNALGQLTQVSMPRNGTTQTRTFQWTGPDLTSVTNPETGTVTYQWLSLLPPRKGGLARGITMPRATSPNGPTPRDRRPAIVTIPMDA
jgi:YD repeat-containing protein